jgi:hypothetical protein
MLAQLDVLFLRSTFPKLRASSREPEFPLTGGWVTGGVVRVGETVRRPQSPNASFVHRLLEHLGLATFDAAPRFLGVDKEGREILTYIAGTSPS